MAQAKLLEEFLSTVRSVHSTSGGTKETSYYTAINNLLDGVGHALKPKVRCVMQLKNLGVLTPSGSNSTACGCGVKCPDDCCVGCDAAQAPPVNTVSTPV